MTQKNKTIVDRVVQRLQTQPLGDLITEEDLHDIVKEAVPKAFLEPSKRLEKRGSWNDEWVTVPAPIVAVAKEVLQASVQKAVDQWMIDNADKVADVWRPIMEQGIEKWVADRRQQVIYDHIYKVLGEAFNRVNDQRRQQGLPPYMY